MWKSILGLALALTASMAQPAPQFHRGVNVLGYDPIWQDPTRARCKQRHFRAIREAGFDFIRVNLQAFRHMKGSGELDKACQDWLAKTQKELEDELPFFKQTFAGQAQLTTAQNAWRRGDRKEALAQYKAAYDTLPNDVDSLSLLSEALNFDFSRKGLDEPFTDEEIAGIAGMQGMRDRVLQVSGNPNPTVRDFMVVTGRGKLEHPWVGGPKEIADKMEEWFVGRACDGFVIGPTHLPGTFEDFVRLVVPELQRRGLFRTEYEGRTLRENLGLRRPASRYLAKESIPA